MEFEQGTSYAIYTMMGSFYTPGKAWKPLKIMATAKNYKLLLVKNYYTTKINTFSLCCLVPVLGFSWKLFLFQHPPTDFSVQKKFPELLDAKYASFGGKKSKWRDVQM